MPSPFPGMDPYLEAPERWPDVHQRLITYIADALQPHLRPHYLARMGERVYVLQMPHAMYPDVLLIRRPAHEVATAYKSLQETVIDVAPDRDDAPPASETDEAEVASVGTDAEVDVDTPFVISLGEVEHREPYIEIVHAADEEIVTIIEVLSPANKAPGKGHRQYTRKQQEILASSVNLVEIDLLSQGLLSVALTEAVAALLPAHRYRVNVRRASLPDQREVYPIVLQQRLPCVHIPLREPEPDVRLDLPAILAKAYDNGGYAALIDYRVAPPVPLLSEEAAWVDGLLQGKGLR